MKYPKTMPVEFNFTPENVEELSNFYFQYELKNENVWLQLAADSVREKKIGECAIGLEFERLTGIPIEINFNRNGADGFVLKDVPKYGIKKGCRIEIKTEGYTEKGCINSTLGFGDISKAKLEEYAEYGCIFIAVGFNGKAQYLSAFDLLKTPFYARMVEGVSDGQSSFSTAISTLYTEDNDPIIVKLYENVDPKYFYAGNGDPKQKPKFLRILAKLEKARALEELIDSLGEEQLKRFNFYETVRRAA